MFLFLCIFISDFVLSWVWDAPTNSYNACSDIRFGAGGVAPPAPEPECKSHGDCADGVCFDGECVECYNQSHCASNPFANICSLDKTCVQCLTSSDCSGFDEQCNSQGFCEQVVEDECKIDAQCEQDGYCCVDGSCEPCECHAKNCLGN